MSRHRWWWTAMMAAVVIIPAGAVTGQDSQARVSGRVIELQSGNPVADVLIELVGGQGGSLSDSLGRFTLPPGTSGIVRIRATRLGYVELVQELEVWRGAFLTITLRPRPITIEGIELTLDRLSARNGSTPFASSSYPQTQLRTSPARDAVDFLARRDPSFRFIPCPGEPDLDTQMFDTDCVLVRNRVVSLEIFVDEFEAVGGLDELRAYDMRDLYRLEFYPRCAQIRVYTRWFIEDVARAGGPLRPIVCFTR